MTIIEPDIGRVRRDIIMLYLRQYQDAHQYLPSVAQIARHTDLPRTVVVWHLEKLKGLKALTFEDGNMSRSLRLL